MDELLSDKVVASIIDLYSVSTDSAMYRLAVEVQARRAAERIRPVVMAEVFDRHVDDALRVTWPAPHGPEGFEA